MTGPTAISSGSGLDLPGLDIEQLAADLAASWDVADATAPLDGWITRTGTLRHVAAALGDRIPASCDRVLAVGPHAEALATAVALATGVAAAALAVDGRSFLLGSLRPGESVVVVAARESDALGPLVPADAPRIAILGESPECLFRVTGSRLAVIA